MPLTYVQKEYYKRIKQEIFNAFVESKYTYAQLQEILEERYNFAINKGTLREFLNVNSKSETLNYACLITTGHFFGFDLNELLMPDIVNDNDMNYAHISSKKKQKQSSTDSHLFMECMKTVDSNFSVLRDDGYMGDFKGYIVTPTSKSGSVDAFNLSLYKDENGVAHAKLVRKANSSKKNERFEYHGIPYHSKAYQSVLIFLTDTKSKGEFYFLSFGFQQYRNEEGLIFRQGLAITGESLRSGSMVSQNFLLFNHDLSHEKETYIPGLLKMPINDFCVPTDVVEELAAEYPEVKELLDTLSVTVNQKPEQVYYFNEDMILNLNRIHISEYDRIKALLLLKGKALIPEKNYYVADSKFSGFAKNHLLISN